MSLNLLKTMIVKLLLHKKIVMNSFETKCLHGCYIFE
jgi:hypothetical protein